MGRISDFFSRESRKKGENHPGWYFKYWQKVAAGQIDFTSLSQEEGLQLLSLTVRVITCLESGKEFDGLSDAKLELLGILRNKSAPQGQRVGMGELLSRIAKGRGVTRPKAAVPAKKAAAESSIALAFKALRRALGK